MKNFTYYLIIIGSIFGLLYISEPIEVPLKTTIRGIVTNPIDDTIKIYNRNYSFISKIDYGGYFKTTLEIDSSDYFTFFHGVETTAMYINPGDQIGLKIDTDAFDETINYVNSEESSFLAKKYLIEEALRNNLDTPIFKLSNVGFSKFCDDYKNSIYDQLAPLSNNIFYDLEKDDIDGALDWYYSTKNKIDSLPKKGEMAINFTYPDINGSDISLFDFRGKYVYVDIWATWCGPCVRELPFFIELEKDYHDSNILFLSVALQSEGDKSKWIEMVNAGDVVGVQLLSINNFGSQICEDYAINSIPRYMLFDPDGRVVDLNAPRPSSNDIRTIFDEIL